MKKKPRKQEYREHFCMKDFSGGAFSAPMDPLSSFTEDNSGLADGADDDETPLVSPLASAAFSSRPVNVYFPELGIMNVLELIRINES